MLAAALSQFWGNTERWPRLKKDPPRRLCALECQNYFIVKAPQGVSEACHVNGLEWSQRSNSMARKMVYKYLLILLLLLLLLGTVQHEAINSHWKFAHFWGPLAKPCKNLAKIGWDLSALYKQICKMCLSHRAQHFSTEELNIIVKLWGISTFIASS